MQSAKSIIRTLDLAPHPEGGWYKETWRAEAGPEQRATGTAIYYLLEADQFSHWHRIDSTEIWHWYAGAPLSMTVSPNGHDAQSLHLGPEIGLAQRPQFIIPPNWWQTATTLGQWSLMGCTVSPGFEFDGFEMAPEDWRPTPRPAG
ncbi:MAG: cupin domain-containing protein [Pseudomonadota bacterium]